jgi:hypothetical protein
VRAAPAVNTGRRNFFDQFIADGWNPRADRSICSHKYDAQLQVERSGD